MTEPIDDRSEKRAAGIVGLIVGVLLFVAGGLVGTLAMNVFLRLVSPRGGETLVPHVVICAICGLSLYGLIVLLQATVRLLEACLSPFAPPRGSAINLILLLLLALEGFGALFATFLIVHQLGLAEFVLR